MSRYFEIEISPARSCSSGGLETGPLASPFFTLNSAGVPPTSLADDEGDVVPMPGAGTPAPPLPMRSMLIRFTSRGILAQKLLDLSPRERPWYRGPSGGASRRPVRAQRILPMAFLTVSWRALRTLDIALYERFSAASCS